MTARRLSLLQVVGPEVFQKAGLEKLSAQEQFYLADWILRRINEAVEFVRQRHGIKD